MTMTEHDWKVLSEAPEGSVAKAILYALTQFEDEHPEWFECGCQCRLLDALDAAEAECERLRLQLAACGVAALQNTEESVRERLAPDNPNRTVSYSDVCSAVDREIALRAEVSAAEAECERLRKVLDWQNAPNRNPAARGAFEFYINEEWESIARCALDRDAGFVATLRKHRTDPDDDRVRVRLVLDDDALLAEAHAATQDAVPCAWSQDDDAVWHTACGHAFEFLAGTPAENDAQYCQYCGRRIADRTTEAAP